MYSENDGSEQAALDEFLKVYILEKAVVFFPDSRDVLYKKEHIDSVVGYLHDYEKT